MKPQNINIATKTVNLFQDLTNALEEMFLNSIRNELEVYYDLSQNGDPDAQFNLALAYLKNPPSSRFKDEAVRLLNESASQGNTEALHQLGCLYAQDDDETSISQSIDFWSKAAEMGNPYSMYNLGVSFKTGRGFDKDLNEAKEWFELAITNGYIPPDDNYDIFVDYQGIPIMDDITDIEDSQRQDVILTEDNFNAEMGRLVSSHSNDIEDSEPTPNFFDKYYGVKGWLLLFCIVLTIISPIYTLITDSQAISQLKQYGSLIDSSTQSLINAGIVIDVIAALIGLICGIQLWNRKKGAANATFLYLVIRSVVYVVLGLGFSKINPDSGTQLIFQSVIYVAIWGTYLKVSKRVKATFPEG